MSAPCWSCGSRRGLWHGSLAYGLCETCKRRWIDHGRPASGPPPPRRGIGRKPPLADRVEDYLELRSWGLSIAQAAARMGVTRRTADRYEAAARQLGQGRQVAA